MSVGFDVRANVQDLLSGLRSAGSGVDGFRGKVEKLRGVRIGSSDDVEKLAAAYANLAREAGGYARIDWSRADPHLQTAHTNIENFIRRHPSVGFRIQDQLAGGANLFGLNLGSLYPQQRGSGLAASTQNLFGQLLQGTGARGPEISTQAAPNAGGGIFSSLLSVGRGLPIIGGMLSTAYLASKLPALTDAAERGNALADQFTRRTTDVGRTFNELREAASAASKGLGITATEAIDLSTQFAQAANETDQKRAIEGATGAAGFGRAYGMATSQAVGMFGRLGWYGVGGGGASERRELAAQLAAAIHAGDMGANPEKMIQDLLGYIQGRAGTTAMIPGGAERETFLAWRAATTLNPALRGEEGMALLGQANAALHESGDMRKELTASAAIGGYTGNNYFDNLRLRQRGMLAEIPGSGGKTVGEAITETLDASTGWMGEKGRSYEFASFFGMSQDQGDAFRGTLKSLRDRGKLKELTAAMQKAGIDPAATNEQGLKSMHDLALLSGAELRSKAVGLLRENEDTWSKARRKSVTAAMDAGKSDEDLRAELFRALQEAGLPGSEHTRSLEATAENTDAIQKAVGQYLPWIHTALLGLSAKAFGTAADAIKAIQAFTGLGEDEIRKQMGLPAAMGGGGGGASGAGGARSPYGSHTPSGDLPVTSRGWFSFPRDSSPMGPNPSAIETSSQFIGPLRFDASMATPRGHLAYDAMNAKYDLASKGVTQDQWARLVEGVIQVESGGNLTDDKKLDPTLRGLSLSGSREGTGRGLMQILVGTARQPGGLVDPLTGTREEIESQLFDPAVNLKLGQDYLASLVAKSGGDVQKALKAYGGEGPLNPGYSDKVARAMGDKRNVLDTEISRAGTAVHVQIDPNLPAVARVRVAAEQRATAGTVAPPGVNTAHPSARPQIAWARPDWGLSLDPSGIF